MSEFKIAEKIPVDYENGISDSPIAVLQIPSLYNALVKHATTFSRLLFIRDNTLFEDFDLNNKTFSHLSTLELSSLFLNEVLPKIHNYQLPKTIVNQLELLSLHPCFRTTRHGYQYESQYSNLCNVLEKRDFNFANKLWKLLSLQNQGSSSESHTMLVACDIERNSAPKFQLSLDIASLLSAMLSTDVELSVAQLHSLPDVQKRLRNAKLNFENTANTLPYRSDPELIVDYMGIFDNMKIKLCSLLYSV